MAKTIFIFDIDSTIANNNDRAALLQKQCTVCLYFPMPEQHSSSCPSCGSTTASVTQASWDAFLDPIKMAQDKPIEQAVSVLQQMRKLGMEVHFITGRRECQVGDVTRSWLSKYAGWQPEQEKLMMRQKDEEGMPASVYKERAFKRLKEECGFDKEDTFLFFEDDPHVFNMYSKYGIVVQCPQAWQWFCPTGAKGKDFAFKR